MICTRRLSTLALTVALLPLSGLISSPSHAAIKGLKEAGKVVRVTGRVLIRNEKNHRRKMEFVKSGTKIYEGDVVNTSSNSKAQLLFTDKSVIDLGPTSLFKVDEYKLRKVKNRRVQMALPYGKIRANITKKIGKGGKFKFRTKTATMGVRGTEFTLDNSGGLDSFWDEPPPGDKPPEGSDEPGSKDPSPPKEEMKLVVIEGSVSLSANDKTLEQRDKTEGAPKTPKIAQEEIVVKAGQKLAFRLEPIEPAKDSESEDGRSVAKDEAPPEPKLAIVLEEAPEAEIQEEVQEIEQEPVIVQELVVADENSGGDSDVLEDFMDLVGEGFDKDALENFADEFEEGLDDQFAEYIDPSEYVPDLEDVNNDNAGDFDVTVTFTY